MQRQRRVKQNQQISLLFQKKRKKITSLTFCCLRCTEHKEKKTNKQSSEKKKKTTKRKNRVNDEKDCGFRYQTVQIHTRSKRRECLMLKKGTENVERERERVDWCGGGKVM